jgi:hypothetical protein
VKKVWLVLLFIAIGLISYAQKISDAYFDEREKYWTTTFKAYTDKYRSQQDSFLTAPLDRLIKNGGRNETEFLKYLFLKYQEVTNKNLDTVAKLYFLKKKSSFSHDFVVWNRKDTIFIQLNGTVMPEQNIFSDKEITPFNNQKNANKSYLSTAMNLISKTNEQELDEAIKEKRHNKDGSVRLILHGSTFEAYIFKKTMNEYKVKYYLFTDLAFPSKS